MNHRIAAHHWICTWVEMRGVYTTRLTASHTVAQVRCRATCAPYLVYCRLRSSHYVRVKTRVSRQTKHGHSSALGWGADGSSGCVKTNSSGVTPSAEASRLMLFMPTRSSPRSARTTLARDNPDAWIRSACVMSRRRRHAFRYGSASPRASATDVITFLTFSLSPRRTGRTAYALLIRTFIPHSIPQKS